jgi:hypothetical protein
MKRSPFVLLFSILFIWSPNASARQSIHLEDVLKITLSITPGGMSDGKDNKKYEVSYENGKWKSLQILDSSTKVIVSEINPQLISRLLRHISTMDTSIHLAQFELKDSEMASSLDSLNKDEFLKHVEITKDQKAVMLNALSDKNLQLTLLRKSLKPIMLDDRTAYQISITTTKGIVRSIVAMSFANIYNLPWNIEGKEIFNPDISRIFAMLTGDNKFDQDYKGYLYQRMILDVFYKFRTQFCLENLERDHPEPYSAMTVTMHPEAATREKHGWYLRLKSSRLSSQISIVGRFKRPDTILGAMKQMEDRLIKFDHNGHYFFKYLRKNPDKSAFIIVTDFYYEDDTDLELFNRIKTLYKPMDVVPLNQINFIEITKANDQGRQDEFAKWMVLPDDSIIYIPYEKDHYRNAAIAYVYDKNGNLLQKLTGLDKN